MQMKKRRKRDKERYAKMTDEEKQDKLKKQHEAYHRRKGRDAAQNAVELQSQDIDANEKRRKRDAERYAKMIDEEKQHKLKKQREAYNRRKDRDATQYQKICEKERQKYANMQPEQKKARIEQAITNRELRSSKTTK